MGQKVNPNGLRIGIIKDWNSKWYADKKDIAKFIKEDEVVRTFIKKKYYQSAISSIKIERSEGKIFICSMPAPCLPISVPGRPVYIKMTILPSLLSILIEEMADW